MKEKQFFKELKDREIYSKLDCLTHYGDDLCFRSAKLAYVKDYKATTANMTYWLRFSDSLDEYIFGMELDGLVGPDSQVIATTFAEVLNFFGLKRSPKQKIPRVKSNQFQIIGEKL